VEYRHDIDLLAEDRNLVNEMDRNECQVEDEDGDLAGGRKKIL
jgi:hypothetical protein